MKRFFFLAVAAIVFIPLIWISYLFHTGNETAIAYIVAVASLTTCFALVTMAGLFVQTLTVVTTGLKKLDSPDFREYILRKMKEQQDSTDW